MSVARSKGHQKKEKKRILLGKNIETVSFGRCFFDVIFPGMRVRLLFFHIWHVILKIFVSMSGEVVIVTRYVGL